jgi:catechol 2,3-dioxygenase-like lactoylglutathione lyase family enzyme
MEAHDMICGIHHAAISTPDLQRCIDFYTNLLGFEVVMNGGWPKGTDELDDLVGLSESSTEVAMIRLGTSMIEVFQYASPQPAPVDSERPVNDHGITHICIHVKDLQAEYERLSAAGMRFNSAPKELSPTTVCVYGRDPDGNVLELIELKDPADPIALA